MAAIPAPNKRALPLPTCPVALRPCVTHRPACTACIYRPCSSERVLYAIPFGLVPDCHGALRQRPVTAIHAVISEPGGSVVPTHHVALWPISHPVYRLLGGWGFIVMACHCYNRLVMAAIGLLWLAIATIGLLWLVIDAIGLLWPAIATIDFLWLVIAANCLLWLVIAMACYGM
jgi:hypothetical protein